MPYTPETTPETGGPVPHDHPVEVHRLPEYHAARAAITALAHAIAPDTLTMVAFVAMVGDFPRSNPYADCCSRCREMRFPYSVVIDDMGWLTGRYWCGDCKDDWSCGYSVDAPILS